MTIKIGEALPVRGSKKEHVKGSIIRSRSRSLSFIKFITLKKS